MKRATHACGPECGLCAAGVFYLTTDECEERGLPPIEGFYWQTAEGEYMREVTLRERAAWWLREISERTDAAWWHDLPPSTRQYLHRHGLIADEGSVPCNTHGHAHPGYVRPTAAGLRALARAEGY